MPFQKNLELCRLGTCFSCQTSWTGSFDAVFLACGEQLQGDVMGVSVLIVFDACDVYPEWTRKMNLFCYTIPMRAGDIPNLSGQTKLWSSNIPMLQVLLPSFCWLYQYLSISLLLLVNPPILPAHFSYWKTIFCQRNPHFRLLPASMTLWHDPGRQLPSSSIQRSILPVCDYAGAWLTPGGWDMLRTIIGFCDKENTKIQPGARNMLGEDFWEPGTRNPIICHHIAEAPWVWPSDVESRWFKKGLHQTYR